MRGLLVELDVWKDAMPVAGGRILGLIRSVQNDLKRENPQAALGHLTAAIEMVDRVQKQVVRQEQALKRQQRNGPEEDPPEVAQASGPGSS